MPHPLPSSAWLFVLGVALAGCASKPAASASDSAEPDWRKESSGKACAGAKIACGVGNCVARIDNRCRQPVTCKLSIQSICSAYTGESGQAWAHAEDTILADDKGGIMARVICAAGDVKATLARRIRCR